MTSEKLAQKIFDFTDGFETGYVGTTLADHIPQFDNLGRPTNTDHNTRWGNVFVNHVPHIYVRKGWIVKVYYGQPTNMSTEPDSYLDFSDQIPIMNFDLTPDYLK